MPSTESFTQYPNFTELQEHHQQPLNAFFRDIQPVISELTFAYLWSWRAHTECQVAQYDNVPIITCTTGDENKFYAFPPLSDDTEQQVDIITTLIEDEGPISRFARVPQPVANELEECSDLQVHSTRDRADYVHRADALRDLPGPNFHAKRNLIRQFEKQCANAEFQTIDAPLAARCSRFSQQWLDDHPKNHVPSLQREVETTKKMLARMDWLGIEGGAILDDDDIVAFALGEPLNDTTFIERVEKADTSYSGSYQAINRAFAQRIADGFEYINREQDLGVEGLRRAKESYHPDHLVHKYEVEPQS